MRSTKESHSKLESFVSSMGYKDLRHVNGEGLCGLQKYMYTWALVTGLDFQGYARRYCFEHRDDAFQSLSEWDGDGHPSGPWIKCKGAGFDLLNPDLIGKI